MHSANRQPMPIPGPVLRAFTPRVDGAAYTSPSRLMVCMTMRRACVFLLGSRLLVRHVALT